VRRNVASLSQGEISSFRKGVAVMKARPDSDPLSWSFQAKMHGTLNPTTYPLFNQYEHGTLLFLPGIGATCTILKRILQRAAGDPKLWKPDALSVTLRPLTPIAPKGSEEKLRKQSEESAKQAKITYKRIDRLVAP
jgi:hypothetical protein